jgi:hypothetical protein
MAMRNAMRRWAGSIVVTILWTLALGCGDDPTNPPVLTDQTAAAAGGAIAQQVVELTKEFTTASFDGLPFDTIVTPGMRLRVPRLQDLRTWGQDCAVRGDSTDSDGDGVPDDFTITWNADSCTVSGDSLTFRTSGSIRVTDPGMTAGFDLTYSNIQFRLDHVNGDYVQIGFNGTHGVSASTTTANLDENITLTLAVRDGGVMHSGSIAQNWNAGFTAATGQMFDVDGVLPDGAMTLNGSTTWTGNGETFAFSVVTATPLEHDADCTLEPDVIAGQLRALVSGNQGGAFIRVLFTGCGVEPIVTLIGQPGL